MKSVHSVISLSFLIILLLVTSVIGSSDDWVVFERYNNGDVVLYNKVSVEQKRKDNIVRVWYKYVYSDESREELIQERRTKGLSTEGWNKLSHCLSLEEIDCKKKRSRMLSLVFYSDNSELYSHSIDKQVSEYIPPGSMMDILRKKVCNW
jgi:hypothetical protein